MTTLPDDDLHIVEAPPDVLADLRNNDLNSVELATYARSIGLAPPEGFWSAEILMVFPENGPSQGILAWLGSDPSNQSDEQ